MGVFVGRWAWTGGGRWVRVLLGVGAIKSLFPAESEGRISLSISRRNDARSSIVTLWEKSTKMTTAVPCWTAAGVEGAQPVIRKSACVITTRTQGVSRHRTRDSPTIHRPVLAVPGDFRPPLHLRILPTPPPVL